MTGRKAEGRRQKAEGRRQKAEDRMQKAEGRRQKAEGRRRKAEGRRQKTEDRRQKAEGGRQKAEGRRREAGGGRRNAEGGRRKAEGGRRNAEGGRRKANGGEVTRDCAEIHGRSGVGMRTADEGGSVRRLSARIHEFFSKTRTRQNMIARMGLGIERVVGKTQQNSAKLRRPVRAAKAQMRGDWARVIAIRCQNVGDGCMVSGHVDSDAVRAQCDLFRRVPAPFQAWALLLSYKDVDAAIHGRSLPGFAQVGIRSRLGAIIIVVGWLVSTISQGAAIFVLMRRAVRGFDAAVGRPIHAKSSLVQRTGVSVSAC
jgi:hypothetical protein